jgi:hypothetical protein
MIIRLLGTGAAPNSTSLPRPYWYDLEAPRRNPRKRNQREGQSGL